MTGGVISSIEAFIEGTLGSAEELSSPEQDQILNI